MPPEQTSRAVGRRDELVTLIAQLPRVKLGCFPTPIEEAHALGRHLGVRVLVKREDLSGLALGGNKVRQLEHVLARAIRSGADSVIVGGHPQSNYCRQCAAAARRVGLRCTVVLAGEPRGEVQGNLLLDQLFGAEIVWVGATPGDFDTLYREVESVSEQLCNKGRRPYIVRPYSWEGGLGFLSGAIELHDQLTGMGMGPVHIVLLSAGATIAALVFVNKFLGCNWDIVGVVTSPTERDRDGEERVAEICNRMASELRVSIRFDAEDVHCTNRYADEGFGVITPAVRRAMRLAVETEGLLLDPLYTAKSFAALIGEVSAGRFSDGRPAVFIHTGGLPLVFAYARDLT